MRPENALACLVRTHSDCGERGIFLRVSLLGESRNAARESLKDLHGRRCKKTVNND